MAKEWDERTHVQFVQLANQPLVMDRQLQTLFEKLSDKLLMQNRLIKALAERLETLEVRSKSTSADNGDAEMLRTFMGDTTLQRGLQYLRNPSILSFLANPALIRQLQDPQLVALLTANPNPLLALANAMSGGGAAGGAPGSMAATMEMLGDEAVVEQLKSLRNFGAGPAAEAAVQQAAARAVKAAMDAINVQIAGLRETDGALGARFDALTARLDASDAAAAEQAAGRRTALAAGGCVLARAHTTDDSASGWRAGAAVAVAAAVAACL